MAWLEKIQIYENKQGTKETKWCQQKTPTLFALGSFVLFFKQSLT
jgi:hypothetical protein